MDKVSIARNPRARHDYHLLETWEAGLVLTGTEVKSLRDRKASLGEAYAHVRGNEVWLEGLTIAPYAAGSSIMFTPAESMAALRVYRNLKTAGGQPLVWRDPAEGGYAFADSFNLDQRHVSDDNIAIDVGPMLVAIENVRTGLVWRLFMQHEVARRAVDALELQPQKGTKDAKG